MPPANRHFRQTTPLTGSLFLFFLFLLLCPLTGRAQTLVPLHVQKGTNLIRIARQYCTRPADWKAIAAINHLKSPYIIYNDSTLQVPLSILHTSEVSAEVISLKGSPLVVTNKNVNKKLHKGDRVFPGQTVVTGDEEYVHLVYPNNKHSRIGPESKMLLVYLMRLADNNLQAEFFLDRGRMTNSIERKLKPNEHFQTRTPMAITGIRGTEFRVKVADPETNIIETLKGRVALTAAGHKIFLARGQGSKVKKGQQPAPPHPLPPSPSLPQLKKIYRTLPIKINAPVQQNARSMHVRVTADKEGFNTLVEQTVKPGKNFALSSLKDGSYFLFLTAIDKAGFESLPSGPTPLHIRTVPGAPIISSPKNNRKFFTPAIKIRWLESDLADHYRIQLARDKKFSKVIEEKETKKAHYLTHDLKPGKYFFRVQLVTDDDFETLFSAPLTWEIMTQPKLDSLNTSSQGSDDSITLRWPAMADTAGYMIQIANDRNFTDIIAEDDNLKKPSYTINFQIVNGKYYVRMRSITKDGLKSPWTPPQAMTVESESSWLPHAAAALGFLALILIF